MPQEVVPLGTLEPVVTSSTIEGGDLEHVPNNEHLNHTHSAPDGPQLRENDSALGDEIQDTPPEQHHAHVADRHLPRQVTFGYVPPVAGGVHGELQPDNGDDVPATTYRPSWPAWLDGSAVCYFFIAGFMIGVGLTITILTLTQTDKQKEETKRRKGGGGNSDVVVWIVGPVFICSGLLVCVKAVSHIYRRMHPSVRHRDSQGHFLTSDSRPSLNRQNSGMPPSYTAALTAPVPSTVIEEELPAVYLEDENKCLSNDVSAEEAATEYNESLRLVTLNFDPSPPSYDEALDIIRKSMSEDFLPQQSSSARVPASTSAHFDRRRCTTLDTQGIRQLTQARQSDPRMVPFTQRTLAGQPVGRPEPDQGRISDQGRNSASGARLAGPSSGASFSTAQSSSIQANQESFTSAVSTSSSHGENTSLTLGALSNASLTPVQEADGAASRIDGSGRLSSNTKFRSEYNSDPLLSSNVASELDHF